MRIAFCSVAWALRIAGFVLVVGGSSLSAQDPDCEPPSDLLVCQVTYGSGDADNGVVVWPRMIAHQEGVAPAADPSARGWRRAAGQPVFFAHRDEAMLRRDIRRASLAGDCHLVFEAPRC